MSDEAEADVEAAIHRVEDSRQTHVAWVAHLRSCAYCREKPPTYIQPLEDHERLVAEYDNVLNCLARLAAVDAVLAAPDDVQQWEDDDHHCPNFLEVPIVTVARVRAALHHLDPSEAM